MMHSYSQACDLLIEIIRGPRTGSGVQQRTYDVAKNVKRLQSGVLGFCITVVRGLEEEGVVEMPENTSYYSTPDAPDAPEDSNTNEAST